LLWPISLCFEKNYADQVAEWVGQEEGVLRKGLVMSYVGCSLSLCLCFDEGFGGQDAEWAWVGERKEVQS
jgi:hypothetical protein